MPQNGSDPNVSVVVTVTLNGSVVGTASIPADSLTGSATLSRGVVGPGFFDLSSQCIAVSAGDVVNATMAVAGASGVCNQSTLLCESGQDVGQYCFQDLDCQWQGSAGVQNGGYANGNATLDGSTFGSYELTFKTYVR